MVRPAPEFESMVAGHPPELQAVHHVGITVASLDYSLAFWKAFLGVEPRWRQLLDAPYLCEITGYSGVTIDACMIDLPGGVILELLDYQLEGLEPNDMATANPGNVHLCLQTDDIDVAWRRAVGLGAQPVSRGPVDVTRGPNIGARAAYLRDPDGITLELLQPPLL